MSQSEYFRRVGHCLQESRKSSPHFGIDWNNRSYRAAWLHRSVCKNHLQSMKIDLHFHRTELGQQKPAGREFCHALGMVVLIYPCLWYGCLQNTDDRSVKNCRLKGATKYKAMRKWHNLSIRNDRRWQDTLEGCSIKKRTMQINRWVTKSYRARQIKERKNVNVVTQSSKIKNSHRRVPIDCWKLCQSKCQCPFKRHAVKESLDQTSTQ